jgi:hypothetical protein
MEELCFDFEVDASQRRRFEAAAAFEKTINAAAAARGQPKRSMVCRYWILNRCSAGVYCRFTHAFNPDLMQRCVYIEGGCPLGSECTFRHYYLPGEVRGAPPAEELHRPGLGLGLGTEIAASDGTGTLLLPRSTNTTTRT